MVRRWKHSLLAVALSAPVIPQLGPTTIPKDILKCERQIIYRNKVLACDSPIAADGEGLRMLLSSSPEAMAHLDHYQQNRRSMVNTAYFGMAGLMVAAFAPRWASNPSERSIWIGGGLALTLGSFAYGRSRLRANESYLDQAIDTFNRANPTDPIQLRRGIDARP